MQLSSVSMKESYFREKKIGKGIKNSPRNSIDNTGNTLFPSVSKN